MARKKNYSDLYVYMNGISVGTLIREPSSQLIFTYNHEWLNWKNNRPISLSMPLTEISYKGRVVDYYFDNLLPDGEPIRERIQARLMHPPKNVLIYFHFTRLQLKVKWPGKN